MLEIKNVTKVYKPKKGVPVKALDNVSLKFQSTGMVFILGKSGSGKSTLLNVLGGLDKYDSGEIIIKGKSSLDFNQGDFDSYRNTFVGFVFQDYNLLEEFTVGANIGLAIELQGRKATDELISDILDQVDLIGYGGRKPNELSGGQLQRVAIARALVKSPEIIMADEPTGALDSRTGTQVFETLKKLSKSKLVIVVSHDREFAELYGDRIIELADGKVISDVEKYTVDTPSATAGINVVDDNFLFIKKGYKLTKEDLELINTYLDKANKDIIISVDANTNDQIKKIAKINDTGNRDSFKDTDYEKFNFQYYQDAFKLIRSKLPFKSSLKIGASGLKVKPVRLFFTILLSFVAFTLFGLADTMGSYNKINATVKSVKDANIQNLSFSKQVRRYIEQWDYYETRYTNMFEEDVEHLKNTLGIDFKPIYNPESFSFGDFDDTSVLSNAYSYYKRMAAGFAEFTRPELEALGFTIHGELPGEFDEIAITDYQFEHFYVAGYKDFSNNITIKAENLNRYEDLLQKEITINGTRYTVTGIIETGLNKERYEKLRSPITGGYDYGLYMLMAEFENVISYGYHSLIYVKPGFIATLLENSGSDINLSNVATIYIDNYYYGYVGKDDGSRTVYMFDPDKTRLGANEILINAQRYFEGFDFSEFVVEDEDIPSFYKEEGIEYLFIDFFYNSYYDDVVQYATDNYASAIENGFDPLEYVFVDEDPDSLTEELKINAYVTYLSSGNPGYINNEYGDKSGLDIEWEKKGYIIEKYHLLQTEPIEVTMSYYIYTDYREQTLKINIAGIFIPDGNSYYIENNYYYEKQVVVVADDLYEMLYNDLPGPYGWVIGKMPTDDNILRKVAEFSGQINNSIIYNMENEVNFMLEQVNNFIESLAQAFIYIGIGFAVFSSLLLFNFISTSISYKKRDIGILRAIGARSKDVFGIFFNESLIIALINFGLALISTISIVIFLNSYLKREFGLIITVLNFGIRQILLMLVFSVGVALFASFLPVYRIALKKPIDAIRNR